MATFTKSGFATIGGVGVGHDFEIRKRGLHVVANVGAAATPTGKRGLHAAANVGVPAVYSGKRGLHAVANVASGFDAPFIGSVTAVYTPTLATPSFVAPFIASHTVVYAPSLPEVQAPFISSVTVVYTPTLGTVDVRPDFIGSRTQVYNPALMVAFTGGGLSQVALEVLALDTPTGVVSQVTVEVLMPRQGLHIWTKQ